MSTARHQHSALLLANGKVLLTGGTRSTSSTKFTVLNTAEIYDYRISSMIATNTLLISRYGHTSTLLPNGNVLFSGGTSSNSVILSSSEIYFSEPVISNDYLIYYYLKEK